MLEISGLVNSVGTNGSPVLQQALTIGRGGAVVVTASALASVVSTAIKDLPRGGDINKKAIAVKKGAPPKTTSEPWIGPRAKAVFFMAVAMSLHYLGYSLARPITISLFTSETSGYGKFAAAFPFAMAFVSPMSLGLLLGYGKVLDKHGPRGALIRSTIFCATVVSCSAMAMNLFEAYGTLIMKVPAAKFVSGPLFVFRESYVQLLTSQYWSFMASALTPSLSAKWFGPIAGLSSITSAVAGFFVSDIIDLIGISYSLLGTGVTLLISIFAANMAYAISEEHGFSPVAKKHSRNDKQQKPMGMFETAVKLFARVPVLLKLFIEILASQGLITILNVAFVARLAHSIPADAERAGWVGKFFSTINIISMVLQFGILPPLLTIIEPKIMWRIVPFIAMMFTTFQASQPDPTLYVVSTTLLVMKVLEYSARRMLDEMVYVPLDFESRFVGKEVIGVFGYRLGKSLMSLGLSGITALFGDMGIQEYSILGAGINLLWFWASWSLSNEVPTRKEAEEIYQQQRNKKKDGGKR
ncbi:expressed unknown protein [Seminavis robusta]|uniref:ADP,ATP carrier protein n=1 Tax=Seminavis robusta TaxID=568900 RepID=A0A9N8DTC4_9STRA|nr:expressed unknown protein [Seminavis robusta]|eukprot:Sro327_g118390.1 n/a (527) ;mRNA; f:43729-45309